MNNPEALENLLPDSTVEDLILEVYNIGLCTFLNRNQVFPSNLVDHNFYADVRWI